MVSQKEENFISAVVYVHNQQNGIGRFLASLVRVLSDNFKKYEIICVDDGSTDNSVEEIKKVAKGLGDMAVSVVGMSFHQGMESAMIAGVDLSIGDFVFEFDSEAVDYNFEVVMEVYRRSLEGYDIVAAVPDITPNIASRFFYSLFEKNTNNNLVLTTERFRILSRRAINRINILCASIPYRKAVYYNCGLKRDSVLFSCTDGFALAKRKKGNKEKRSLAVNSLLMFTDIGVKLAMYMASLMILFTVCVGIYTMYIYFGLHKPVEGWTTLMLFLTAAFFGVFSLLAILIKYVSLIFEIQQKKQNYIYDSVEKLKQ